MNADRVWRAADMPGPDSRYPKVHFKASMSFRPSGLNVHAEEQVASSLLEPLPLNYPRSQLCEFSGRSIHTFARLNINGNNSKCELQFMAATGVTTAFRGEAWAFRSLLRRSSTQTDPYR